MTSTQILILPTKTKRYDKIATNKHTRAVTEGTDVTYSYIIVCVCIAVAKPLRFSLRGACSYVRISSYWGERHYPVSAITLA